MEWRLIKMIVDVIKFAPLAYGTMYNLPVISWIVGHWIQLKDIKMTGMRNR